MIPLPAQITKPFDTVLAKRAISENVRAHYRKWLRYYWNFCHKYQFDPSAQESLPPFLKKLQAKNQSESLRKQAQQAVSIYYEMSVRPINGGKSDINVGVDVPLGRRIMLILAPIKCLFKKIDGIIQRPLIRLFGEPMKLRPIKLP